MTSALQTPAWNSLVSDKSLRTLHGFKGVFRKLAVRLALARLRGASSELRQAAPRLAGASKGLEQQFLTFQKTLEGLSSASADLIFHGEQVVTMAGGQETGDVSFQGVFALLNSPLEYLSETQSSLAELAAGLRSSVNAIARLLQIERALEATVAPLAITQVMFRIQSAYLPGEHRQVFAAVTDEIVALQVQIQSAFAEHARVLTSLHGNLLQAVEALERQLETQGRQIGEKKTELKRYLAAVTAEIENNAGRHVELTAAGQELAAKVSSAVVSMQTQDIVAQKLEHARGGIADVVRGLDRCEAENESACFTRVALMTRVEVAQLDSVIGQLENSDASLHLAFGGIADLLEKLNGGTLLLNEFREMTVSATGSIQGLLNSLAEVHEMVAVTLASTKMAEDSVLPVRNATEGLTNTVQGVAHEMHLIALNSQIQAIQMGEGTGLDVLAAHSTEVSQATTQISMEVTAKVSEVAAAVAEYSDRLSALRESGERQQKELEERGQRHETALHGLRDRTLDQFRATAAALDRAREFGAGIATLLNLKPAVEQIQAVRSSVAELQRQSEAWEKTFVLDESHVSLSNLERKYTMASERRVHAEVLAQRAPATTVSSVELWDEDPATPAAAIAEEHALSPREPVSAGVAEAGAAPAEFGEGVELF